MKYFGFRKVKRKAHAKTFIIPEAKLCSSALRKRTALLDARSMVIDSQGSCLIGDIVFVPDIHVKTILAKSQPVWHMLKQASRLAAQRRCELLFVHKTEPLHDVVLEILGVRT